jgi:hypothetical protein
MVKPASHLHPSTAEVMEVWTLSAYSQFSGKMKPTGWTYGRGEEMISEFCKTCLSPERERYLIKPTVVKEV